MLHWQMCGRIFQIWAPWIDSKTIDLFHTFLLLFCSKSQYGCPISSKITKLYFNLNIIQSTRGLTLIRLGGGPWWPPLDISRDYSATREAFAATLYDNFLSSFPHILIPNLWRPGVRFRSYVTLCTCTSDRKWLQNVFSLSSYKYAYFYSQLLKLISFWFIVLQKVSATNFGEKNNKNKMSKKKRNT